MTGVIITYLPNKNYGFIKGDDKKDYFFHKYNIDKKDQHKICDGALVTFEQKATPKGYKATKIVINSDSDIKYNIPDNIYTSKSNYIKGWENVFISHWIVHSSSRKSPDEAKKEIIEKAKLVGANSILNLEYYKTTGSEPGTGYGTHYFTIHNFKGQLANIGKKSLNGKYSKDDLSKIDIYAKALKEKLKEKTQEAKVKRIYFWIFMICLIIISWVIATNVANNIIAIIITVVLFILTYILSHATNYDSWLEEIK